jgi:hypothetical protein
MISTIIYFTFVIICLLLFIIDIVLFIKDNGCNIKGYFIHDDPFHFRIEFYLVFILILILFLLNIPSVSWLLIAFASGDHKLVNSRNWVSGFGFLGAEIAVLFIPWYGILVSFLRKIRFKKQTVARTDLEECLNDKDAYKMFKKFASSEWSIENIYFIEDLENLKKETTKKSFENNTNNILKTYIFEDSPLEINISRTNRKNLIVEMKKLKNENVEEIFRSVENEVYMNLQGSFERFQRTEKYNKWKKNSKRVSKVIRERVEVISEGSKTLSSPRTIKFEDSDLISVAVGSDAPIFTFDENTDSNDPRSSEPILEV